MSKRHLEVTFIIRPRDHYTARQWAAFCRNMAKHCTLTALPRHRRHRVAQWETTLGLDTEVYITDGEEGNAH